MPYVDEGAAERLFRYKVLTLLRPRDLLKSRWRRGWPRSRPGILSSKDVEIAAGQSVGVVLLYRPKIQTDEFSLSYQ